MSDEQKANILEMATGSVVTVLEFRSEKPEVIKYIDKKKHVIRYMVKHAFTCEYIGTGEPFLAELYTPRRDPVDDDKNETEPPVPAPCGLVKGDRIIAVVGGLQFAGGNTLCKVRSFHKLDGIGLGAPAASPVKDYKINPPVKKPEPALA